VLAPCLAMPRGYGQACAGVLFHTLVTSTTALLLRQRSWSWSLLPLIVRASLSRSLLNPCLSACAVGSCGRGACHARPTRRCKAAQRGMMSQQQRKWQSRKPLLTVVVPGADVAPDRSHLEPRRSLHGARRSSVLGLAVEPWVRRLRALALLCGALALALLLLLQAVRGRARHKAPLVTLGMGPTDEQARTRPPALTRSRHADPPRAQRCCGPAPCAREFIVPIVKASKRDTRHGGADVRVAAGSCGLAAHHGVVRRGHAALQAQLGPQGRAVPGYASVAVRAPAKASAPPFCRRSRFPRQVWPRARHREHLDVPGGGGRTARARLVVRSRRARCSRVLLPALPGQLLTAASAACAGSRARFRTRARSW